MKRYFIVTKTCFRDANERIRDAKRPFRDVNGLFTAANTHIRNTNGCILDINAGNFGLQYYFQRNYTKPKRGRQSFND